jgi:dipeptidyl aminopeptidase/acylaminoacyl peptidase
LGPGLLNVQAKGPQVSDTLITPELLWTLPRVGAPVAAGHGRVVVPVTTYDIAANKGTGRIWLIEADHTRRPLTALIFNASKPVVDTTGTRLAFVGAVGDEKIKQVYVSDLDREAPDSLEALTSFPLGALGGRWLPDGQGLVVLGYVLKGHLDLEATASELVRRKESGFVVHVTEDATYRYWDAWLTTGEVPHLFRVNTENGDAVDLTPGSTRWWSWPNTDDPLDSFAISPDGRHIAFAADSSQPPHRSLRRHLYELDLGTLQISDQTPDGAVQIHRPRYSPDGAALTYGFQVVPDHYGDPVRLGRYDRGTGEHRRLADGWDRSADQWEFDGRGDLLIVAEDAGYSHLFRLTTANPYPQPIAGAGSLGSPTVDRDGTVYMLRHSLRQPPEVVRLGAEGALIPLTDFAESLLQDIRWGEVEALTIAGADGDPVQMFLIHPPRLAVTSLGEEPPPLLHLIHGGPYGAFTDGWQWRWHAQSFAARGFLVAMVNFHGSSSFGQAFASSILGGWGDKPYRDIEAATDLLVSQGLVDEARMAVAGGSYGGYLVAFITAQTDRYACAIAHAAVTNLGGMYASDITGGRALAYGAEIFEDRATVERYSPSSHAAGYGTPTLVIHGERDYRVPVTQGLELYGVLKAMEVPARLVYYPSENHWILNPQPSLHWYGEIFSWLDVYLR